MLLKNEEYCILVTDWAYKMKNKIRKLYTEEYYFKTAEETEKIVEGLKARGVQFQVTNSIGCIVLQG